MDRRLYERYAVDLQATISDLAASERVTSGQIVDISQSGLCAVVPLPLATGAIVKVEIGDCALFGHVTYCQLDGPSFRTGIEVVQVLIGSSDLARLVNALLTESMPSTPGIRSVDSW